MGIAYVAGALLMFVLLNPSKGAVLLFAEIPLAAVGTWSILAARASVRQLRPPAGPRGLNVAVDASEVTRGEAVHVSLALNPSRDERRQLEVGLVCTRFADTEQRVTIAGGEDTQPASFTVRAVKRKDVFADWVPVTSDARTQSFEFAVPAEGPFSYEGATVSWAYRASVRERRRLRADARWDVPIWVRP